ncbi:MAG: SDR family NAD(P)-dependent oxidoreductase, partial [Actinobacteria bacterium]|nr:SDR family NAD(P)-dependent oxidoreductase [Actinomycetota bacterium]
MSLSRSIEGRVAIVTGAGSGMGRATARLFAEEGASVAVVDLVGERVLEVVDEIKQAGGAGRVEGFTADLGDRGVIPGLVDSVVETFGPVDILINNAGMSFPSPIDGPAFEEAWDRSFAVNLTAQAFLIRACLPHLRRNGEGRIVNIASTEGLGASAMMAPYTASKHGV